LLLAVGWQLHAQQDAQSVRDAVAGWYATLSGNAMDAAGAYGVLAPALQKQMSQTEFQSLYANTAHVDLLQMHLGDQDAQRAKVLVEDRRVQTIAGIPAMVWYTGFLALQRGQGGWEISNIDLKPEDIAGPKYRAEEQWQMDPVRVADRAVGENAMLCPDKMRSKPGDAQALEVFVCTDKRTVLDMAHLYSSAWVIFRRSEEPLDGTKTKGAATAAPNTQGP
jgi:hypothetical protein